MTSDPRDAPVAARAVSRQQFLAASSQARLSRVRDAQASVRTEAARRNIRVVGSSQTLLNALFVRAAAPQAAALRGLPEVARVVLVPPLRPLMDRAANLVRAPGAWAAAGGMDNAGAGVRIGIIDSGLDDQHPAFQDSALAPPADLPAVPEANIPYTNSKIIVARSYVDRLAYEDDTTPRDRMGHGTAVAVIAGGAANSGPAASIAGIAPKAWLGNYKIFGSPGVNDNSTAAAVIAALEDALVDRMDVVTLAVGAEPLYPPRAQDPQCTVEGYGLGVPSASCDPLAEAVERAVDMGLTVVVPAGDDGNLSALWYPTFGTIFSPGTAPSAITVGASLNSYAALRVEGDGVPDVLQHADALFGDGPKAAGGLSGAVRDVTQSGDDGYACSPLRSGSLANSMALVERGGDCYFADKVLNAQQAGAIGIVFYQSTGNETPIHPLGLSGTSIPAAMIGNTAGLALKAFVRANPDRTVTLDPTLPVPGAALEQMAGYSSRGPGLDHAGTATIKPEVVAPGESVYSGTQKLDDYGYYYDPSGYTYVDGTSISAAVVAGVAALVKQQHPEFTAAQVKSAVVNTAVPELADGENPARVNAAGAGKVNAEAAVVSTAVAEPATISFGALVGLPVSVPLKVTNTGKDPPPSVSAWSSAIKTRAHR